MDAKLDASALDRFVKKLEQSPQVIKGAKRRAFEAAAPKLKAAVDTQIGGSGRVRSWQESFVGSGGGYAKARPKKDEYIETKGKQRGFRAGPKKYPVGHVTCSINSGHRAPRNTAGYRTSGRTVEGRHFYRDAQAEAEKIAQEAVQQIVQALVDHLEG